VIDFVHGVMHRTALLVILSVGLFAGVVAAGSAMKEKNARNDAQTTQGNFLVVGADATRPTETAVFAAGCFWGVEDFFRRQSGVVATSVGYTGGKKERPTYHDVCDGQTGHAEAVRIEFDPLVTTYARLVGLFFDIHDPTTLNRQGPDVGTQYRSAVFAFSPAQKRDAEAALKALAVSGALDRPIVTEVVPAEPGRTWQPHFGLRRDTTNSGSRRVAAPAATCGQVPQPLACDLACRSRGSRTATAAGTQNDGTGPR
jgi:peptide-methionine (S)-S-oxide reductase